MIQCHDIHPTRDVQLGQCTDLKAAIRQDLQERVVVALIGITVALAGVEELGRTLGGELETGLGEVAGYGTVPARIGCENSFRDEYVTWQRTRTQGVSDKGQSLW